MDTVESSQREVGILETTSDDFWVRDNVKDTWEDSSAPKILLRGGRKQVKHFGVPLVDA